MNRVWLIFRDNYVIDRIYWDGVTPFTYPNIHDQIIEDTWGYVNIGDWYEVSENVFYRPLSTPPDYPV
jgi:hypothetical protein